MAARDADLRRLFHVAAVAFATLAVSIVLRGNGAQQVSSRAQPSAKDFREDFQVLIAYLSRTYAYLPQKATQWSDVPRLYDADLNGVRTPREFVGLLERVLDELYDAHLQLTVNTAESPRLVPSGTDIWAQWISGRAVVTEIRPASDAERADVRVGDVIVTFDEEPIERAVDRRIGRSVPRDTVAARDWALRAVLAGRHNAERRIALVRSGARRRVVLPPADQFASHSGPRVEASVVRANVAYIRFNDSLGDDATIGDFDQALGGMQNTTALLLDCRDTPSGGNSTVARGILGRFVERELPYQKHVLPSEERDTGVRRSWLELVSPRLTAYRQPVAVLVDHWTGSMGEGLAIGLNAVRGAPIVGTRMAGLNGATYHLTLPHSGIGVNVPAEQLFHVNGTPREKVAPTTEVDLAASSASSASSDPILAAGLRALAR